MCKQCDLLFETINSILSIPATLDSIEKADVQCDATLAKNSIFKWLKHIIRHDHQDKAKQESLRNQTALLIWEYCQKVLPMAFREGQCNYFGKIGMMLHVDALLLKYTNQIHKHTCFTTAYRSDLGIADSLTIASLVIEQVATDFPNLKELFGKSDNASSYHGNLYSQSLYKICKPNEIYLLRFDYNEPPKGKDQCDREAAVARNAL